MRWTPEEDEVLRKAMSEGRTKEYVAKKLPGRTRNSVIGRAHRLGFTEKTPALSHREKLLSRLWND